jgi:hypothetical protein
MLEGRPFFQLILWLGAGPRRRNDAGALELILSNSLSCCEWQWTAGTADMQWITAIGVEDESNVIYSSNQDTLST